jgi:hypothetical protein
MRGSELAGLADILRSLCRIAGASTNKALLEVCKKNSEELRGIQLSFHKLLEVRRPEGPQKLNIACYFEAFPMQHPLGLVSFPVAVMERNAS